MQGKVKYVCSNWTFIALRNRLADYNDKLRAVSANHEQSKSFGDALTFFKADFRSPKTVNEKIMGIMKYIRY